MTGEKWLKVAEHDGARRPRSRVASVVARKAEPLQYGGLIHQHDLANDRVDSSPRPPLKRLSGVGSDRYTKAIVASGMVARHHIVPSSLIR